MSLIYTISAIFFALLTVSSAQTCYYPDGTIATTDVACSDNGEPSACCSADSFCLSNGLCAGGAVLTRASCTDETWESDHCATVCTETSPNTKISLTPCGGRSFACGLNTTGCITGDGVITFDRPTALVLRPSQIAALLEAQGINTTVASTSAAVAGRRMYSSSTVLAIGLSMAFPILFLSIAVIVLYRKLRTRKSKSMYDLPTQPAMPMMARSLASRPSSSSLGRSPTIHTTHSTHTLHDQPAMPRSFLDRYAQKVKEDPEIHEIDMGNPRYELGPSQPEHRLSRAELNGDQPTIAWEQINKEAVRY